jgi:uridine phosphorylase
LAIHTHHLGLSESDLSGAKIALLPGDPERVPRIAEFLDTANPLKCMREFHSWFGVKEGTAVIVVSTGVGAPSTCICVEELAQIGVRIFIRVGSTGSIQEHVEIGDTVISTAAVRLEGASRCFAPIEYPAVADIQVTNALVSAAEALDIRYHTGITASTDSFYPGQERYDTYSGYVMQQLRGSMDELRNLKVLNYEMEAAALFTMCSTLGLRAAGVCGVAAKRTKSESSAEKSVFEKAERAAISIAIQAIPEIGKLPV